MSPALNEPRFEPRPVYVLSPEDLKPQDTEPRFEVPIRAPTEFHFEPWFTLHAFTSSVGDEIENRSGLKSGLNAGLSVSGLEVLTRSGLKT